MCFYGVIEEIWVLDYTFFKVLVLKCAWVNNHGGVKTNDLGFTLVELERYGHKDNPFILVSQAKQVFYVQDPKNARWSCVIHNSSILFDNKRYDGNANETRIQMHFPAKAIPSTETILNLDDNENSYVRDDGECMYID